MLLLSAHKLDDPVPPLQLHFSSHAVPWNPSTQLLTAFCLFQAYPRSCTLYLECPALTYLRCARNSASSASTLTPADLPCAQLELPAPRSLPSILPFLYQALTTLCSPFYTTVFPTRM